MIRRIAVLTSGESMPGMNAVIRAVTRAALDRGWEVMGIRHGYDGLISTQEFIPLTARSVGGIMQRGGTMLGSMDSKVFSTDAGRGSVAQSLAEHNIDALIVIGDGEAQSSAYALSQMGVVVNGVPCSLENDLAGSDMTVGVDTALNIALETIDHLKATSSSCCYAFLVEVAGRKCGYLALMSGIAGGAEAIVIPEVETTPEQIAAAIAMAYDREKPHALIVVAEGAAYNADKLLYHFDQGSSLGVELRATTLSQVQHGGAPSAYDRLLGTRLGACAVDALARSEYGVLAGSLDGKVCTTPFAEVIGKTKILNPDLIRLSNVMAL